MTTELREEFKSKSVIKETNEKSEMERIEKKVQEVVSSNSSVMKASMEERSKLETM